jgi:Ca2+-binding RTX toxin-like protein
MTISSDLFMSILSLDAYNRGYGAGISGLGGTGSEIGNATILDVDIPTNSQAEGFYAVAYTLSSGPTIISYRGTDEWNQLSELVFIDLATSYFQTWSQPQFALAKQFFDAVDAANGNAPMLLTGHSLGGALAGITAALTGTASVLVDNIGFNNALEEFAQVYNQFRPYLGFSTYVEAATQFAIDYHGGYVYGSGVDLEIERAIDDALSSKYAFFRSMFVEGSVFEGPQELNFEALNDFLADGAYTEAFHLLGSIASLTRSLSNPPVSTGILASEIGDITAYLPDGLGPDRSIMAHSVALNVLMKYIEQEGDLDFLPVFGNFLKSYTDPQIALDAGFAPDNVDGVYDPNFKMMAAIGYSAIDEGTRVFGDTGIRALFNDLNGIGARFEENSQFLRNIEQSALGANIDSHLKQALTDAIVQFAGEMALRKVTFDSAAGSAALQGIVFFSSDGQFINSGNPGADGATADVMFVDLSSNKWDTGKQDDQTTLAPSYLSNWLEMALVKAILPDDPAVNDPILTPLNFPTLYGEDPKLSALLSFVYGEGDTVRGWSDERITAQYIDGAAFLIDGGTEPIQLPPHVEGAEASPGGAAILVLGTDGDNNVVGSVSNEIYLLGAGNDTVMSGDGKDIVLAGDGDDLIVGGLGPDLLDGGDGNDVLYGGIWPNTDQNTQGGNPTDYKDDRAEDYLFGGTGVETYYASASDVITDAEIFAVDDAAEAGPVNGEEYARFVADGDGQVYFDGRLLTGGERIAFGQWDRYPPTPGLNIMVTDPNGNYVQRALFIDKGADAGPLYYRIMNAYTYATDGTRVDEWLLIVEDPNAGTAITITGAEFTPGAGLGEGFLGLSGSAAMAATAFMSLSAAADSSGGQQQMAAIDADAFVESLGDETGGQPDLRADSATNTGLGTATASGEGVLPGHNGVGIGTGGNPPGGPNAESGGPEAVIDLLVQDSAALTTAATTSSTSGGFLGISIVEPVPAPDTAGNDLIRGTNGNDTLTATEGNDTLKGSGGNDLLNGGWGADSLDAGSGTDTATYVASNAGVQVYLYAGSGTGGHAQGDKLTGIENVTGSGYADSLYGTSGNNVLIGQAGNDYFEGRGGVDTFDGGKGNDAVGFAYSSTSFVTVNLGTGTFGGLAAGHTYISIESFGGTNNAAQGDTLTGSDVRNDLYGYAGNDLISGAGGTDLLDGGDGADTIDGGTGNDQLIGGDGADMLTGGAGFDIFTYYTGNSGTSASTWDIITDFTQGSDLIDLARIDANSTNGDGFTSPNDGFRWIGTDPIFNGSPGDLRYEHVGGNTHLMGETNGDGVVDFVIVLQGLFDLTTEDFWGDSVTATGSNAPVYGTEGADTINGTLGTDIIYSLGGDDRVYGDEGYDTIYGGGGNDRLEGWLGADQLHGEAGNDTLIGGANTDTLYGGAENDELYGYEYHDLLYGGDGNDRLNGDKSSSLYAGQDTLYGGAGDDTLWGGAYIDYYDGGDGTDHVILQDHTETAYGATIDLAADTATYANGNVEWILNIENVTGTFWADTIYGDDGSNYIDPSSGADTVFAGAGDDHVKDDSSALDVYHGGAGIDTLEVSGGLGNATIDMAAGTVTHGSGTDTFDGFENLIAGGGSDLVLGDANDNRLEGYNGHDTIRGGVGADTIEGGAGNDQHFGEAGDDLILGSVGADYFDGGAGTDTLDFSYTAVGATFDLTGGTVVFDGGQVETALAFESVIAGGGADRLTGTSAANQLSGNAGNDTLIGGAGDDSLSGGLGADQFVFTSTASGVDVITDFNELNGGGEEGDVLRLEGLGVGTFAYLGAGSFSGGSDNSEARVSGSQVLVDTNGDGTSDITITLAGLTNASQLSVSDFVFV